MLTKSQSFDSNHLTSEEFPNKQRLGSKSTCAIKIHKDANEESKIGTIFNWRKKTIFRTASLSNPIENKTIGSIWFNPEIFDKALELERKSINQIEKYSKRK